MDSLDEKQKAFEERMKSKLEEAYAEDNATAKEQEKSLGDTLGQAPNAMVQVKKLQAELESKYGRPKTPQDLPPWCILKTKTIETHMNMMAGLIQKWFDTASRVRLSNPVGVTVASYIESFSRELDTVFRVLVENMNRDNQERQRINGQQSEQEKTKKKRRKKQRRG